MGAKYFLTNLHGYDYFPIFLYGYEIIFYKFGQKYLDHAQFLEKIMQ